MASNDMVEVHGLKPQDFESIRDAVMETPRGRWFLHEYANRLRGSETSGIIDSMKRLENAVSANHDALMSRLASALAHEAATPSSRPPQADLAPKHMKFFKQDEEIFEAAPQAAIAAVPDVARPEPKPEIPKGARVVIRRAGEVSAAAAPPEPPSVEMVQAPEPMPSPQPLPQFDAMLTAPPSEPEAAPKRRIVIIRHKPGDLIDVPLQNEMSATG